LTNIDNELYCYSNEFLLKVVDKIC
jgi:hypothetical protein